MKKRIISLVLVGVLTLSILGGCGKKEIPLGREYNRKYR